MQNTQTQQSQRKNQAIRDQVALFSFIDDLIKEKNDSSITPQNQNAIRELLLKHVNDDIDRHLITLLSSKDQLELDLLLKENTTPSEIHEFFVKKIPHLESEIAAVLLNFRAAYLLEKNNLKK